jgi:hypothetical protein
MRNGFLGSMSALLAGAGLALAQRPASSPYSAVPAPAPAVQPAVPASLPARPVAVQQPPGLLPATPAQPVGPGLLGAPQSGPGNAQPAPAATPPAGPAAPAAPPSVKVEGPSHPMPPADGCPLCCPIEEPLCGLEGRFYADADYLLWWAKGDKLPPLVTTGVAGDLRTTATIDKPTTTVLFGDKAYDEDTRSGLRFRAGFWLDGERSVGIEASFFLIEQAGTDFAVASNSSTILARPFVNADLINVVATGLQASPENSLLVAFPGIPLPTNPFTGQPFGPPLNQLAGSVTATTRNDVWGFDTNARINLSGCASYRADLLIGFRYLRVTDDLGVNSISNSVPGSTNTLLTFNKQRIVAPFTVGVADSFRTTNDYYGGQIGAHLEGHVGRLFADFRGLLALGVMHQSVDIAGSSTLFVPGPPQTVPGGLLAQVTNIGNHHRDEFGIVPEVGVNVGWQFGAHLRAHVGYSILYCRSDVVRPGTSIDRAVTPNLVPVLSTGLVNPTAPPQPVFGFRDQDFWVQGLNFGVEVSF